MKFGNVADPEDIKLSEDSSGVLQPSDAEFRAFIGLSIWNKSKVKGFYPREAKDELAYYSTQFNSIELNATFFKLFPASTFREWSDKTASGFVFFPKMVQEVTHLRRLNDFEEITAKFIENVSVLGEKLGVVFLQMHNNFSPGNNNDGEASGLERIRNFIDFWKANCSIPLAIEVREIRWHNDPNISNRYYQVLQDNEVANIIIDTAGRRDLIHMRLTTPTAFIRFVGCNKHEIDFKRLDEWAKRIAIWKGEGLQHLYFFLHENEEKHSAILAAHFIQSLNKAAGLDLEPPTLFNRPAPTLMP